MLMVAIQTGKECGENAVFGNDGFIRFNMAVL